MKSLILTAALLLPYYGVSAQSLVQSTGVKFSLNSSEDPGYSERLDELRNDIESMSTPLSETSWLRKTAQLNHAETEMPVRKRRMWMLVGINAGTILGKQLADRTERKTGRCGDVILSCRGEKIGSMIIGAWLGAGITYAFTHRE